MKIVKGIIALSLIPIAFLQYFWHAYVTTILWRWFVSSQFGLPELTMTQAMGLGLIVLTFTTSFARIQDINKLDISASEIRKSGTMLLKQFTLTLFMLLTGWIIKGYM